MTDRAERDRATLVDFIHNSQEACDEAAKRLAGSADPYDRLTGTEWLRMRQRESSR